MFSLRHSSFGHLGELKFSQAGPAAFFKGITKGLAIKYVSEGQENYLIGENTLFVKAGQFIVLPEKLAYQTLTSKSNPNNLGICIDLNSDEFQAYLPNFQELDLLYGVVFSCKSFTKLPTTIEELPKSRHKPGIDAVYRELGHFAHEIFTIRQALNSSIKKTSTQKEILSKLYQTKEFIHSNFTQHLSLKLLSKHAGISSYHLNRLFSRSFGQTPFELQLKLKMEKAKEMLQEEFSMTQIAFELGYNDLAAFSNQFKKRLGESPTAFRKSL